MNFPKYTIDKKELFTLFRIYRKTIAYALIVIVIYSTLQNMAQYFITKPVIVAAQNLEAGTLLTRKDLKEIRTPAIAIAPGFLTIDQIVGRMLSGNIAENEQISATRVLASKENTSDQRVVGVRIVDSEIASILKPGAIVDVVRLNKNNELSGGVVAAKVSVVAIATKKSSFGSGAGSIVMVTTSSQNALALAINSGEKLTVLLH